MTSIAIYGSHNASVAIEHRGQFLVVELERFLGIKNVGWLSYKVRADPRKVIIDIIEFAKRYFSSPLNFDRCIYIELAPGHDMATQLANANVVAKLYTKVTHHVAHAAGTFYQSPFEQALVVSFDGGGNDGMFNIYRADRKTGIEHIAGVKLDLGFGYMLFGDYLACIKKEKDLYEGNLVYAGKIMGLCGYGTIRNEWIPYLERYYKNQSLVDLSDPKWGEPPRIEDVSPYTNKLRLLGQYLDIPILDRIDGVAAYDLVASSQRAFENVFFEVVDPYRAQYPELPLCLTGGCSLNIILNAACKDRYKVPVYVAPNSSDCGLAFGALMEALKPQEPIEAMYLGIPLLDGEMLPLIAATRNHLPALPERVAQVISSGKIVGVARGRSEHGPRALGNRSILCDPSIPNIKNYLHATIKKREKFRPFAPVVRAENASKYFTISDESPYMSFMTMVRPEWQERLAAITHIDGSARVQTVTAKQNKWLYDLLGEFENLSGHGVLLNTSFNADGRPILSTLKEAFDMFDQTCLDALVVEDLLFNKS